MTRCRRSFASLISILFLALPALASDWPGWLGPDGNGISPETGVFGMKKSKLAIKWERPLGKGYSGIAVVDGKAVTMYADGENDVLVALAAESGKELWRYEIDVMFPKVGGADGGQNGMPVVDAGVVYGLAAKGQLFAVSLKDGSEIWKVETTEKLGGKQPYFGYASTPLVVGDLLFVQTGGPEGHSLTGLDKKTGKVRWSHGDEAVGYQSPIFTEIAGEGQIIAVTNKSVLGLDVSGKVLWQKEHGLVTRRDGWSTPVKLGENKFVLTGGGESAAFEVGSGEAGFVVEELWRAEVLKGNFAMPIAYEGHLYGYNGDFLECVDATDGKRKWKSRSDAAGLVLVDGHLVLFASDGDVVVGRASSDGFEERTRIKVAEKAGLTYPSFSDGNIFVRNLEKIARVEVR